MLDRYDVLVVGAGQAGFQFARALRQNGFAGTIGLINNEALLPYQRPPLTKAYLVRAAESCELAFAERSDFSELSIDLMDDEAVAINPRNRTVVLGRNGTTGFGDLVLATGASNRRIAGAHSVRTRDDAETLRAAAAAADTAVIIGAGFLGLEVASSLVGSHAVTVVEAQPRAMSRALSELTAARIVRELEKLGVTFEFAASDIAVIEAGGNVAGVRTARAFHRAPLVLASIGATPNTALAAGAGLAIANGITVDDGLQTSSRHIYAIGDCASYPSAEHGTIRLECVQNAVDQANYLAARLTGKHGPYVSLPWFWSEIAGVRLQIAGICTSPTRLVPVGDPDGISFSMLAFAGDILMAVESFNAPRHHMVARRLLKQDSGSRNLARLDRIVELFNPA